MSNFWRFIKNAATETTSESIELRIEGDIIDSENAWIYEWFGIPVASPNAFRKELAKYSRKDITVWINSYGGSVFAAAGMYNALMEHKKTGAKIITKADAKVMSAATIPYMAGDERYMGPMDIFMMHNPLTSASGYASDLRKIADVLDTVKETIMNAYQLGTGLPREKISSMMDDETYMSAKTAVKEGFATNIQYIDQSSEEINNEPLNFAFNRLSIVNNANETAKSLTALEDKLNDLSSIDNTINQKKESEEELEIKNLDDLKNNFPDLCNELILEATNAERDRLKAIDDIAPTIPQNLVNKAKYESPMSAQDLAFETLQVNAAAGTKFVAKREEELNPANEVPPAGEPTDLKDDDENAIVDKIAAGLNQKRKEVKN